MALDLDELRRVLDQFIADAILDSERQILALSDRGATEEQLNNVWAFAAASAVQLVKTKERLLEQLARESGDDKRPYERR